MCGVYLNRARVVGFFLFLPIALVLSYTEPVLVALNQDADTAVQAQRYMFSMLPAVFCLLQYEPLSRYLMAQEIFLPQMVLMIINSALHIVWCYLFVIIAGLEVFGVGLATSLTWFLNLISLTLYVNISKCCEESWICIDMQAFQELREFLRFGLPSALEMFFEWGAFELIALIIGIIGVNELASSVMALNALSIFYIVTFGVGCVATTFIGNSLGDNSKHNAILYIQQ